MKTLLRVLKEFLWSALSWILLKKKKPTNVHIEHETSEAKRWGFWRCPGNFTCARWCDPLGLITSVGLLPVSAPRSICSCLASTLADFHQPYQGCWPPQDLRILLRLHPPSSQSSVNIKFQSNRKRRQKSNLIELVKYWCFDTHSTITSHLANWTCNVSDSFLSVLNAGFLCSTLPYTLYSCLVIRLSCYLPRRSKSCQPSTWRNPDANCYSAVLRLCAAISSSRTALLCRSVTHWEYNSNWADLRYGGEVQIVAQKRLFGLVWPDTFHCGSQCWWVGGSRSRKRAREKGF